MPQRYALNVVVFGLEDELSSEVKSALSRSGTAVVAKPVTGPEECIRSVHAESTDVVLCGPNLEHVKLVREQCPGAAIIVLSRAAEVSAWLDAIEAGADDYYAAPLDTAQVRWMIESMRTRRSAA